MKWTLVLLLILIFTGCAAIQSRQHANELNQMRQDDEACIKQGLHYPDADYVSCRYNLENARLHYAWKCVQMLKCTGTTPTSTSPRPIIQTEAYKPLDVEHFRCWPEPQFGVDYIFCGVKHEP
jgi:hypothetical protein